MVPRAVHEPIQTGSAPHLAAGGQVARYIADSVLAGDQHANAGLSEIFRIDLSRGREGKAAVSKLHEGMSGRTVNRCMRKMPSPEARSAFRLLGAAVPVHSGKSGLSGQCDSPGSLAAFPLLIPSALTIGKPVDYDRYLSRMPGNVRQGGPEKYLSTGHAARAKKRDTARKRGR